MWYQCYIIFRYHSLLIIIFLTDGSCSNNYNISTNWIDKLDIIRFCEHDTSTSDVHRSLLPRSMAIQLPHVQQGWLHGTHTKPQSRTIIIYRRELLMVDVLALDIYTAASFTNVKRERANNTTHRCSCDIILYYTMWLLCCVVH